MVGTVCRRISATYFHIRAECRAARLLDTCSRNELRRVWISRPMAQTIRLSASKRMPRCFSPTTHFPARLDDAILYTDLVTGAGICHCFCRSAVRKLSGCMQCEAWPERPRDPVVRARFGRVGRRYRWSDGPQLITRLPRWLGTLCMQPKLTHVLAPATWVMLPNLTCLCTCTVRAH